MRLLKYNASNNWQNMNEQKYANYTSDTTIGCCTSDNRNTTFIVRDLL